MRTVIIFAAGVCLGASAGMAYAVHLIRKDDRARLR